jgi:RNA polymerase sigma factor (sigma-70 family)
MSESQISDRALTELIESRNRFLDFLRKRTVSAEAAEDLLQNAFLKALEKGGSVRDEESMVAWFYRVLRNSIVDYYRLSGNNRDALDGMLADLEKHAKAAPEVENEICQCVQPLLQNLKPEYREALTTIDLGDGSLSELAGRAHITEGNAAVRVHRAREAMRKQVR